MGRGCAGRSVQRAQFSAMASDRQIWRVAMVLVARHGDQATRYADRRLRHALLRASLDASPAAAWLRVTVATEKLLRVGRGNERPN
jgi:hypothetical protein